MILGKKEIKNALQNIELTKKEYQGWEIDNMIIKYYNIPEETLLEEITEPSNEFDNITEVYDFIDYFLEQKGSHTKDFATYRKGDDKE
jgi:hypothetical protein